MVEHGLKPTKDPNFPFGRNGDGSAYAPYGYTADRKPRQRRKNKTDGLEPRSGEDPGPPPTDADEGDNAQAQGQTTKDPTAVGNTKGGQKSNLKRKHQDDTAPEGDGDEIVVKSPVQKGRPVRQKKPTAKVVGNDTAKSENEQPKKKPRKTDTKQPLSNQPVPKEPGSKKLPSQKPPPKKPAPNKPPPKQTAPNKPPPKKPDVNKDGPGKPKHQPFTPAHMGLPEKEKQLKRWTSAKNHLRIILDGLTEDGDPNLDEARGFLKKAIDELERLAPIEYPGRQAVALAEEVDTMEDIDDADQGRNGDVDTGAGTADEEMTEDPPPMPPNATPEDMMDEAPGAMQDIPSAQLADTATNADGSTGIGLFGRSTTAEGTGAPSAGTARGGSTGGGRAGRRHEPRPRYGLNDRIDRGPRPPRRGSARGGGA